MKKDNKKWMLGLLFCMMSVFLMIPSQQVQAAPVKSKAKNAYAQMLSKKTIKRDSATVYKRGNCYFAIAYIDKNNIPELIIYNTEDASHIQGWGALYTFRNGKVQLVGPLMLDNVKRMGYYEKTGWFTDNTTYQGYGGDTIQKLNKGKVMEKVVYHRETFDNGSTVKIKGFAITQSGEYKTVNKTQFNRSLSYNTKNVKFKKFKFYKNTKANRIKYLKN